jgi:hypothetical protein
MASPSNPAARRFALVVSASVLWKVAALAVAIVVIVRVVGGGR